MNEAGETTYTAESIIQEMGWDWNNLEHPARMVAEYCAKKLNEMGGGLDSTEPDMTTPVSESSFMATRAGANGKVFGEQVQLSKCCQSEIVANNKCSNCGHECEEIQHESTKLSESLDKIKNRFKYLD